MNVMITFCNMKTSAKGVACTHSLTYTHTICHKHAIA